MNSGARRYIEQELQPWRRSGFSADQTSVKEMDDLLTSLPEGYAFDRASLAGAMQYGQENVLEDGLLMLWNTLEKRLSPNSGVEHVMDCIGFGASLLGDVNAFAFPCPNGAHGICVDLQLSAYLLFSSIAICAHYEIGGPYRDEIIGARDFASEIGARTLWFLGLRSEARQLQSSIDDMRRLTPTKTHADFCMQLMRGQVMFVISHEIAHILAGHTNEVQTLVQYFSFPHSTRISSRDDQAVYSRSQLQELEADRAAVRLALGCAQGDRVVEGAMFSAANILFSIFHYFERLLDVLYGECSPTHPPAADRRRVVNDEFKRLTEVDPGQAKVGDFVFEYTNAFAKEVKRPS